MPGNAARDSYLDAVAQLGAAVDDFKALTLAAARLESEGAQVDDAALLDFLRKAGDGARANRLEARRLQRATREATA